MTLTDGIAIYAAIIATVSVVWQIYLWIMDKPKLKIDIMTDMLTEQKLAILDFKNEHPNNKKGLRVDVANISKIPTTITFLAIQPYIKGNFRKVRHTECRVLPLNVLLKPGELWSHFFPDQSELFNLSQQFDLELEVHHSFSSTPIKKLIHFNKHR